VDLRDRTNGGLEKITEYGASWFELFKYYMGDQINKHGMSGVYGNADRRRQMRTES